MRTLMLTLAIVLASGCTAEPPANDNGAAATPPVPAPTTPSRPDPPVPPAATPSPDPGNNTVAARFHGRYATDAAACADAAHESGLTVEPSRIAFHESSGPIRRVAQGPNEVSISVHLTGEGATREANYSFRLSDDGNTLVDLGNGGVRQRCN